MIATGIVKRFDDLGRIAIPKVVREGAFGTTVTEGKPMEIFYERDGTIIIKPYFWEDEEEGNNDNQRI